MPCVASTTLSAEGAVFHVGARVGVSDGQPIGVIEGREGADHHAREVVPVVWCLGVERHPLSAVGAGKISTRHLSLALSSCPA